MNFYQLILLEVKIHFRVSQHGGGWGGTHPHRDPLLPLWRLVPPHPPPDSRPTAKSVRETLHFLKVEVNLQ